MIAYPHVSRGLWIISIAEILTPVSALLGFLNLPILVVLVLEFGLGILRLAGCATAMREARAYWKSFFAGLAYIILIVPLGLQMVSGSDENTILAPLCTVAMLLFVVETCFTTADLLQDRDESAAKFGKDILFYIVLDGAALLGLVLSMFLDQGRYLLIAAVVAVVISVIFYYKLITFLRNASVMLAYGSPEED